MFEAEAEGLAELKEAGAIRVPDVYDVGTDADGAYIEMERFNLDRGGSRDAAALGEQLAALHRHTADLHGWHRDNTIGMTPQHNPQTDDWVAFFREHRLKFQLDLAERNGYAGELQNLGNRLAERLEYFFEGYDPAPSLLHGDLWAGNWGVADGVPVIFDPAVYYGDRETDIAMTRLFGGFGAAFYREYERAWPLAAGSEERLELYKLYHVLNHLNLFGSGYLDQALSIMRRECSQ
jgi:fructosamine-3-kinase